MVTERRSTNHSLLKFDKQKTKIIIIYIRVIYPLLLAYENYSNKPNHRRKDHHRKQNDT